MNTALQNEFRVELNTLNDFINTKLEPIRNKVPIQMRNEETKEIIMNEILQNKRKFIDTFEGDHESDDESIPRRKIVRDDDEDSESTNQLALTTDQSIIQHPSTTIQDKEPEKTRKRKLTPPGTSNIDQTHISKIRQIGDEQAIVVAKTTTGLSPVKQSSTTLQQILDYEQNTDLDESNFMYVTTGQMFAMYKQPLRMLRLFKNPACFFALVGNYSMY